MTTRFSRSAKAISAGVIAASAALQAVPAVAGPEEDAFAGAGYSLCDARLIALYWGSGDIDKMIFEAGEKVINGYKNQVDEQIEGGRKKNNWNVALCPATDFYSKKEIAAFAEYWDVGRSEAVNDISLKLLRGEKSSIDEVIKEQLAKG